MPPNKGNSEDYTEMQRRRQPNHWRMGKAKPVPRAPSTPPPRHLIRKAQAEAICKDHTERERHRHRKARAKGQTGTVPPSFTEDCLEKFKEEYIAYYLAIDEAQEEDEDGDNEEEVQEGEDEDIVFADDNHKGVQEDDVDSLQVEDDEDPIGRRWVTDEQEEKIYERGKQREMRKTKMRRRMKVENEVTLRWLKLKRKLVQVAVAESNQNRRTKVMKLQEYARLDKICERFERAQGPSTEYIMGPVYGPWIQGRAKIHFKRMQKVELKLEGIWAEHQETEEDELR